MNRFPDSVLSVVLIFCATGILLVVVATARADEPVPIAPSPATADEVGEAGSPFDSDAAYPDEPPLDFYQRQWRWYSRHARPQRFSSRDLRRNYGYNPPLDYQQYPYPYAYGSSFNYPNQFYAPDPYSGFGGGYIQGRHDERRFLEWKEHHDTNKKAFLAAMEEGAQLFREAEYAAALGRFVSAAKLNNGDPASRLHAAFCLVAIGNYDEAVLMLRRACQLQSQIPWLDIDIRSEYGPTVDFDAHLQRLETATQQSPDDAGLWMLLGFYHHCSGDQGKAYGAIARSHQMAPADRTIRDLYQAVRMLTPSAKKP